MPRCQSMVRVINGVPIIVERAMWWPGPTAATWSEAHNSAGTTRTGDAVGARGRGAGRRLATRRPTCSSPTRRAVAGQRQGARSCSRTGRCWRRTSSSCRASRNNVAIGVRLPRGRGQALRRHRRIDRRRRQRDWSWSGPCTRALAACSGRPAPTRSRRRCRRPDLRPYVVRAKTRAPTANPTTPTPIRMPHGSSMSVEREAPPQRALEREDAPLHRAEVAGRLHPRAAWRTAAPCRRRTSPSAAGSPTRVRRPSARSSPGPSTSIITPTNPIASETPPRTSSGVEAGTHAEKRAADAEEQRLDEQDRDEAGERLAGQHVRARQRGHQQPRQRPVGPLDDEAQREPERAPDDAPQHALREGDHEGVARAVPLARLRPTARRPAASTRPLAWRRWPSVRLRPRRRGHARGVDEARAAHRGTARVPGGRLRSARSRCAGPTRPRRRPCVE